MEKDQFFILEDIENIQAFNRHDLDTGDVPGGLEDLFVMLGDPRL